jgi:hypothetical protein
VFIGPLGSSSIISEGDARPTGELKGDLVQAAQVLRGNTALGVEWVVRSDTTGATAPVTDGWVDNAFDTQRRRGNRATQRNVF